MGMTYASRRKAKQAAPAPKGAGRTAARGPSLRQLAGGAVPTREQLGRQVDLPGAIREKMETSFGADFSGVKVYESQTVADAGAQAVTMGSSVVFAPGQLDLASSGGQALLGHELSHVVSQAKGESRGQGFLADAGLESQADRQGAMAAAGETVYAGPVTPISAASSALAASGPMQAKKKKTKVMAQEQVGYNEKGRTEADNPDDPNRVAAALKERELSANESVRRAFAEMPKEYLEEHPEIMEGLIGGAGERANQALTAKTAANNTRWEDSATQLRGSEGNNPFNVAMSLGMAKKLEGNHARMTEGVTGKDEDREKDMAHLSERMQETGVNADLEAFTQKAFQNGAGSQFTPEQRSAMVMQNFMTRAVSPSVVANSVSEDGTPNLSRAKNLQKAVNLDKETGNARDEQASEFLGRMSGPAAAPEGTAAPAKRRRRHRGL